MANTSIRVDTVGLGINWQLGQTYRVEIDDGFVNQAGGLQIPVAGGVLTTFTTPTNPPQIIASAPLDGTRAANSIQAINLTFDRSNVTVLGGNIKLYQLTGNVLKKTQTVSNATITGNTVQFNIVGNVEANTSYYFNLDANIVQDRDGFKNNAVSSTSTLRFISPFAATISQLYPANNTVAANSIQNAIITLDRNVTALSGNVDLYDANTNALINRYTVGTTATISNQNISVSLIDLLDNDKYYYITTSANIARDATFINFPGISSNNIVTFKAPLAPTVVTTSPITGTTANVNLTVATMVLDRTIYDNGGNILLYSSNNSLMYSAPITFGNVNTNLDLSIVDRVDPSTSYYILTSNNAVKDISGIKFSQRDSSIFNFTTPTAPTLSNTYPVDGNINSKENQTINFTFDRTVQAHVGNVFLYSANANTLIETYNITSNATFNGNTVSFDIRSLLEPSSAYYITTSNNVIKDATGLKYPGINSSSDWNWTTAADFSPIIPNTIPQGNWNYLSIQISNPLQLIVGKLNQSNLYTLKIESLDTVGNIKSNVSAGTFISTTSNYPPSFTQTGYRGGYGGVVNFINGGGGGGGSAGSVWGGNANANIGGNGGAGISSSISGNVVYYGGGGGGSARYDGISLSGIGIHGGGNAGSSSNGIAGTDGLGGGGGAAGIGANTRITRSGGIGGNGIVIIRYLTSEGNIQASGGNVTTINPYTIHTFSNSSNLTITSISSSIDSVLIDYLIVGGGGGGAGSGGPTALIGNWGAGGGGGGGVRQGTAAIKNGTYPVTVGIGGATSIDQISNGSKGGDSSIFGITALGGGGGSGGFEPAGPGTAGATSGGGGGYIQNNSSNIVIDTTYQKSIVANCYIQGNLTQINNHLYNLQLDPIASGNLRYSLSSNVGITTYFIQNMIPDSLTVGSLVFPATSANTYIDTTLSSATGTGNFTYEAWLYNSDPGNNIRCIFDTRKQSNSTGGWMLRQNSQGWAWLKDGNDGGTTITLTGGRFTNIWQHVALVRQGLTVNLYIGGSSVASGSTEEFGINANYTDANLRIGAFIDSAITTHQFNGYMDSVRVSNVARYTTTFTPQTIRFTPDVNTLLYLQGNTLTDSSQYNRTITVNGNISLSGSIYIN